MVEIGEFDVVILEEVDIVDVEVGVVFVEVGVDVGGGEIEDVVVVLIDFGGEVVVVVFDFVEGFVEDGFGFGGVVVR